MQTAKVSVLLHARYASDLKSFQYCISTFFLVEIPVKRRKVHSRVALGHESVPLWLAVLVTSTLTGLSYPSDTEKYQ